MPLTTATVATGPERVPSPLPTKGAGTAWKAEGQPDILVKRACMRWNAYRCIDRYRAVTPLQKRAKHTDETFRSCLGKGRRGAASGHPSGDENANEIRPTDSFDAYFNTLHPAGSIDHLCMVLQYEVAFRQGLNLSHQRAVSQLPNRVLHETTKNWSSLVAAQNLDSFVARCNGVVSATMVQVVICTVT